MGASTASAARLFLALWPPPRVRQALHAIQTQWLWPEGAALVDPARLHVTLHFLGQVPLARIDEFTRGLAVPCEPHVLDLAQARNTRWPGGLAVLEFDATPELARLHAALAQALRSLDCPVEARAYRPHVTFARRAFGARPPADAPATLPSWRIDDGYVLVRSVPGRGYEVLHAYRPA
ncbi:RNA 2',3'-cyclic phosphodiesterase [Ramlibacter henchirensis]|uniref:RNA 2',3'-cyclic phosphodiesterase n=1 Tax=Ramlibacter henchirensis TaxID=204072 RepID=A0A4Z0BMT3_9BURK|nr:RNA 2',3'-cyclic phosphodiesterase [Ramlibacter henchirensis]TFY99384.1 RNA 2',3'-cyclic phosphodiesterase [Ramlibacter henchirensis]